MNAGSALFEAEFFKKGSKYNRQSLGHQFVGREQICRLAPFFIPNWKDFYDYEGYAQNRMTKYQGEFTSRGYVSCTGATPLDELMRDNASGQWR